MTAALIVIGLSAFLVLVFTREQRKQRQLTDAITKRLPHPRTYVCAHCGTVGLPRKDGMTEVVLFTAGALPALLQAAWDARAAKKCHACKQRAMMPTMTPVGRKLLEQHR